MKKFLREKNLRRGSPTAVFVESDGDNFWLGVYHELKDISSRRSGTYRGIGNEYDALQRIRISKELYQAFVKEIGKK